MSASRYRPQHLEHFATLHQLHIPRVTRHVARILKITLLLLVLFLVFTPWIQTAPGEGSVTAFYPNQQLQAISALVDGRVKEWYVRDGSPVKKGDAIVEIVDNDPQLMERLTAERDAKLRKYEAATIAMETALLDVTRRQQLYRKGLAARRDYEQSQIKYKELKSKAATAQADMAAAETKLSRQNTQMIVAPSDGIITRTSAGDVATMIKAGDTVATFIPDEAEPAVELFVNGLDIALIQVGRKVRLQFEGWPVVQFSGWPSVAIGTFAGVVKVVDPSVSANGKFRILVTRDPEVAGTNHDWPDERFLRFGARAKGWVLLNEVPLGYELWRQLNHFPPNMTQPITSQAQINGASGGNKASQKDGKK